MADGWANLTYKTDATFGDRIFVNMPYRSNAERSNKLTMWVSPVLGREDEPGIWRFHAKSGGQAASEAQTTELLAGFFTLLAGHGFTPEKLTFSALAMLAQRPQHHIPNAQRDAARGHIQRQKNFGKEPERQR